MRLNNNFPIIPDYALNSVNFTLILEALTMMNEKNEKPHANSYAKYSGLAFQMLFTILLFTYAGIKLDEWQGNRIPGWTLALSLISIAASLYRFIRGVAK